MLKDKLEERKEYMREYGKTYRKDHKEAVRQRILDWNIKNPEKFHAMSRRYATKVYQTLKAEVLSILGGRCSNPNCRHLNEDSTLGCTDPRLLQVDHKHGNGSAERKKLGGNVAIYRKIIRGEDLDEYRLLCAQCNWLHRYEEIPDAKETYEACCPSVYC